jgi:hypothetical protein
MELIILQNQWHLRRWVFVQSQWRKRSLLDLPDQQMRMYFIAMQAYVPLWDLFGASGKNQAKLSLVS